MSVKDKIESLMRSSLSELNKKETELKAIEKQLEWKIKNAKENLDKQLAEINKKNIELENAEKRIIDYRENAEKSLEDIAKRIDNKINDIIEYFKTLEKYGESPLIVNAYIEACFALDEKLAYYFEKKRQNRAPALANEIRNEYKKKNRRLKELEYLVSELWVEDEEVIDEEDFEDPDKDDEERVKTFLSDIEYRNLSETERNQLAFDRYLNKSHSKSHIGKMYERYIGYIYEQDGYEVEYRGIEKGLKDGGIDLVCRKKGETLLIQCKCWNQESTIYEKHICQLYGATRYYDKCNTKRIYRNGEYINIEWNAIPIFITTTQLDDQAKMVAEKLGVIVRNILLCKDYPMIKGNISSNGDKIYHLPFDQMYDHTKILPSNGERWFYTVSEAEKAGFRRAKRHFFTP